MVYDGGMYSVKQFSELVSVTPRTLHYYDAIGLLEPSLIGENGYRFYGEEALLRMQQILFYRELGISLMKIKNILQDPAFDVLGALEKHRVALEKKAERLKLLQATVKKTILYLRGEQRMEEKELFEGFNEEKQHSYAIEAEQMFDADIVRASNKKWQEYSTEKKKMILDEGKQIYMDILAAIPKSAASPEVQACVDHWRKHMSYFWTPDLDQLNDLAELYNTEPRFKANFNKIDPQLAAFMREAVCVYVKEQKKKNS